MYDVLASAYLTLVGIKFRHLVINISAYPNGNFQGVDSFVRFRVLELLLFWSYEA